MLQSLNWDEKLKGDLIHFVNQYVSYKWIKLFAVNANNNKYFVAGFCT